MEDVSVIEYFGKVKILFEGENIRSLIIKFTATAGDSPIIEEVEFIPVGYSNINLDEISNFVNNPSYIIKTEEDKKLLKQYLSQGVNACVVWKSSLHGSGRSDFILVADGNMHNYKIRLPALGYEKFDFKIGCLRYPLEIEIDNDSVHLSST